MIATIDLILDLDGVLITTPSWKSDFIHKDGYSDFNSKCVFNLNQLLSKFSFNIYLSSARRIAMELNEFNRIFITRNLNQPIKGYLPQYNLTSRKEELEKFVNENVCGHYIIIDDDKSNLDLPWHIKKNLILTNSLEGFTTEKLSEALKLISEK